MYVLVARCWPNFEELDTNITPNFSTKVRQQHAVSLRQLSSRLQIQYSTLRGTPTNLSGFFVKPTRVIKQ